MKKLFDCKSKHRKKKAFQNESAQTDTSFPFHLPHAGKVLRGEDLPQSEKRASEVERKRAKSLAEKGVKHPLSLPEKGSIIKIGLRLTLCRVDLLLRVARATLQIFLTANPSPVLRKQPSCLSLLQNRLLHFLTLSLLHFTPPLHPLHFSDFSTSSVFTRFFFSKPPPSLPFLSTI